MAFYAIARHITSGACPCRLETTDVREGQNAAVVLELRQTAETRLQAMEAAVASSLLQQQELYSSIHSMTGSFMQQKGSDFTALQVGCSPCLDRAALCKQHIIDANHCKLDALHHTCLTLFDLWNTCITLGTLSCAKPFVICLSLESK